MSAEARSIPAVAQYDSIAGLYQRSKGSPVRRYIECYTLFAVLGEVTGLRVLDLACGEGFYTRLLRERGACALTGVDVSPAMIGLARQAESRAPLGISYLVHDVASLPVVGEFDLVTAAYLLHYAQSRMELAAMCRAIARQLPPGGRFVTINENARQPADRYAGYLQYGFSKRTTAPRVEGSPITYSMVAGREFFEFTVHHYEAGVYEACLRAAGFTDLRWHPVQVDPAGVAAHGPDHWREYLDNPPIVALACRRGT